MRQKLFISLGLLLAILTVYWQVGQCEFINYDDHEYVAENPRINHGFTSASVTWALTAKVVSNWHPLTVLSHMLDCQLFGLNPHAHHLVNLLFHALNALLLFHVLQKLTHELWPSAIVAALFALHPLHVESVAWISERKDVLSAFFGLLTIWAYSNYVTSGVWRMTGKTSSRHSSHAARHYVLALLFFALGLMSKPMLVTIPFVLVLLDYWPLRRFNVKTESGNQETRRFSGTPVIEKIPFFALAAASSLVTMFYQRGAIMSVEYLTIPERISNALVSYARYLGKTFWPTKLAIFYPHPGAWPAWQIASSAVLLAAISVLVIWQIRRRPFLAAGWFWFLGTLVPVIGLVQVGSQSMADRYSYIPLIGIFVMVVWGAKEIFRDMPNIFPALATTTVLIACAVVTFFQVRHWKNSETLFRHTLAVTGRNANAHFSLANALTESGRTDEAMSHLEQALELRPDYAQVHGKIAQLLAARGKTREAIGRYYEALRHKPDLSEALNNLCWTLATSPDDSIRNGSEAVRLGERACEITHWQKTIYIGTLAAAYAEAGRFDDAIRAAEKARAIALETGEKDLAETNSQLLKLYRAGKPFREEKSSTASKAN